MRSDTPPTAPLGSCNPNTPPSLHTLQEGVGPSEIASLTEKYAIAEPDAEYDTYTDLPRPLTGRTVKHHCPPPVSERMALTLKHAGANWKGGASHAAVCI